MAKNVYFSGGTRSEQRLYEDLIIESLKIYGHDVYYLPREIVSKDDLFTEDVLSKFDENYMIEMYISNYEGFEGDGSLLSKFGVRIADEATFIIAKRRWEDLIASSNNLVSAFRPNEGDAIYLPLTDQLFQIKFVEHEKPFRQLDGIQTYGLVAELMEFSNERLETGVSEIDYILGDPYATPHEDKSHFIEKIWQLPETYLCFTEPNIKLDVGPLPALSNDYITFGCFSKIARITDNVISTWSKILLGIPSSKLFLKDSSFSKDSIKEIIYKKFSLVGINKERLILEGKSPRDQYLKTYNRVDIALSPFPYGSVTTSAEGLWMGVPIVVIMVTT